MNDRLTNVLIIEDSDTIEIHPPSIEYKIARVSSLSDAIELLDEVRKYDVILLDLNLLIRYIKQMDEACRVDREAFSERVISTWKELTQRLSTLYASLHNTEHDDFVKWVSRYSEDKK